MLIQQLQRALHHSDAVEGMLILSFIERAADLRNDLTRFLDAMKERKGDNR